MSSRSLTRLILLVAFLAGAVASRAQTYGNEWIDYSRQYWKFPIAQDGFYRITYNDLVNGGFPVSTTDPHLLKVFARGQECAVYVAGESDNSFDPGDFIELYARKNDAWLDSVVYADPLFVPNPHYSLFNDTLHYFLTTGTSPGLRTVNSTAQNFADFTPLPYCFFSAEMEFHNEYLIGQQDVNGISLPLYEKAEGWFDYRFPKGGSHEKYVPTSNAYTGSDAPEARALCISASASMATGFPNHHLQVGWGDPLNIVADTSFYGYQLNQVFFDIPPSSLGNTTRIVHRSVDDLGVASDYNAVSFIRIDYARTFDASGVGQLAFAIPGNLNASYALIEITGYTGTTPRMDVIGHAAQTSLFLQNDNGILRALVPMNGSPRIQLLLSEANNFVPVTQLAPVTQTGFFTNYTTDELQDGFVILTHPSLLPAAQNYAAWRNTGESQSLVVNVEELYMQYAYGIEKNPLAIRRFCNDLLMSWGDAPEHLFIVGKSIHDASVNGAGGARNDPDKYARNLVPTWGYPGSDIAFTAGLAGTMHQPAIPTGRLAANNTGQVLEYLNKVIEHETQPPALWQKNMLHFGGGTIDYEQNLFRSYLNAYKAVASDTSMGAQVYSFFKNTSDPIQMNVSDSIQLLINQGVSMMTFFGHAYSTGFDQNIDNPESYYNQGKYPLLIGNSCYTGNIHLGSTESASETFVLVPNRGVIGFLAKSDVGLPAFLDMYTSNFYRQIFQEHYGKSIGFCMKRSIENFQDVDNLYRANVAYNFALHGDPAITLHPHAKPDYSVSAQDVIFSPQDITASQTTFDVKVVVKNIGKATDDAVGIELIRHYPNGVDSSYFILADHLLNVDTITFTIPNNTDIAAGQNTFDILVDYPLDVIDELDNNGNNIVIGASLLITSGDLFPVSPYAFEVTDNPQSVLYASTGFAFEPPRQYTIQADTTDLFNSPMLHSAGIYQSGGVISWPLPFAMTDSMVVFWRCSADSLSPENSYRWHGSSFQYIANNKGWGQDHFFQFRNDAQSNLGYDEEERRWTFSPTTANLKCEVYGAANTSFEGLATRYQLNLNIQEYGGYGFSLPAIMVAVLDSSTFTPWESNYNGQNPDYDFGNTMVSANARQRTERYFIFQQNDASQLSGFADMIEQIPDNNYVLIYTWQFAQKDQWDNLAPEVYDAFASLGASGIVACPDSVPFIFFTQKGHPESNAEVIGTLPDDYLVLEVPLTGSLGSGSMRSPLIGPAKAWHELQWDLDALENIAGDSSTIRLHGVTWQGGEQLLAVLPQTPEELDDLSTIINVDQYPFLRLEASLNDLVHYTAPQTDRWHVLYGLSPECALDPISGFYFSSDTVQHGATLDVAIAIRNISAMNMDSLKVNYVIEDAQRVRHLLPYPLQQPLLAGAVLFDTLQIDTREYPGSNALYIEVNPLDSTSKIPHQPEQYHFNNLAKIDFHVTPDDINPLLDVTFDGQHILNGDIVSAQPFVAITLDDESEYFILNEDADTSNFRIYLRAPGGDYRSVFFSSGELEWIPASAPSNKFRIDYTPILNLDGKYTLKVQGTDKSGNISGDYEYQIEFEVMNKPTITEVLNYPNPFSTRTQFVFTLTGVEPPDQFKIQIMTVSGDIVREITQDELGIMRIGRNLTDYWWDGKDEYGDQLANGIYLYRVVAKLNGENIEMNETNASRFFNRGFGKMYLMR